MPITIELPTPHAAQQSIIAEARRFSVVCCGRRWGKTVLGMDRLIRPALEGNPVAWCSPSYRMLNAAWSELRQTLDPVTVRASIQEHTLELIGGGVIEAFSLDDPNIIRGRRYKRLIVDEAAWVKALDEAWMNALRPTLTDLEGDAWFLSTPRGMGFFRTLWQWGQDPSRRDWASWQMPTSSNPHIPPAEIEAARQDVTEMAFRQEYLAEFVSFEGAVFRRVLEAATVQPGIAPDARHQYIVSVDWGRAAGGDATVFCVIDLTARAMVAMDRFTGAAFQLQKARLWALYERWRPQVVIAEQNSIGLPVIEALQREGLNIVGFQTTHASKAYAVDALALMLERGELAVLNDPLVIGELQAFEAEQLPSGLIRYAAASGSHDDIVMALAIAAASIAQASHAPVEYEIDMTERVHISDW